MTLYGMPGTAAISQTVERALIWGGTRNQSGVLTVNAQVDGTIRDAGASPTTAIRAGLLVGKETSSGQYTEWDADATDGSQDLYGVMGLGFDAQDHDGNNEDKLVPMIVKAPLRAASLLIQGTALTSHADEFLARRQLALMGCVLDDDPQGYLAGVNQRVERVTGTTDTVVEADNGKLFIASNASAVAITLPTIHAGLKFSFLREGDEEMDIVSAEGDNIVMQNNLTADEISITTATEHIGGHVEVEGQYINGTLYWVPKYYGSNTITVVDA